MTLGALIDLGVPIAELQEMVRTLGLSEVTVSAETVQRCGVAATQVHVHFPHQHVHRRFSDIRSLIEKSPLSDRVKSQAIACFRRLAEAEARVHRTTIEEVHFHEVGALDAIVDIVGSSLGARALGRRAGPCLRDCDGIRHRSGCTRRVASSCARDSVFAGRACPYAQALILKK